MFLGLNDVAFLAAASAAGPAPGLDPDAAAYITAVETADTQELEQGVRDAINDFVLGCKADGIWNAIKASCILAGARTLNGALVPLVGTAPTNNNFVSGDYDRKTGLVGDGSTKYLDSNRSNSADLQNSKHVSLYASSLPTTTVRPMLAMNRNSSTEGTGSSLVYNTLTRLHDDLVAGYTALAGFIGLSRSTSANYVRRNNSTNTTLAAVSASPISKNILLFADSLANDPLYSNARLAFYSIGESLDLALLDARVTTLINAFDAAI
jgi:hypothetical protein